MTEYGESLLVRDKQRVDERFHDIPEAENPLQCRYCGKILTRVLYRKEHERIHTGEKPFECVHCGKRFNSQGTHSKHERTHVRKGRTFECEHCGRRFYEYRGYKNHLRIHTNNKPYSCSVCDRSFGLEAVLKKHMLIHNENRSNGYKQYPCSTCSKVFFSSLSLRDHARSHALQRLHKCHYCNLRFISETKRSIHEKCHEKSDVHQCNGCGGVFHSAKALATHEAQSEIAGGCDCLLQSGQAEVVSSTDVSFLSKDKNGMGNMDIAYIAKAYQEPAEQEEVNVSDRQVMNDTESNSGQEIYPTGLLRSTNTGIKEEPIDSMASYEDSTEEMTSYTPDKNGLDGADGDSSSYVYNNESQQYILSPVTPVSADDKGTQTEQSDVEKLYSDLEASGKIHECKSCQIIFRNYTMFLVHKTLHSNPKSPFCCHICDHESKDNVDFNAHLIWHMK